MSLSVYTVPCANCGESVEVMDVAPSEYCTSVTRTEDMIKLMRGETKVLCESCRQKAFAEELVKRQRQQFVKERLQKQVEKEMRRKAWHDELSRMMGASCKKHKKHKKDKKRKRR